MTASNNSPPSGPKGWTCPRGCPRVLIVHQWHFRKSEASFPWLVQTVCLLLVAAEIFGLEEIHNYRSWLWASDNEQSGRPGAHHRLLGRQYNVLCNNWKLPAKITKIKAPRCFKVSREGVFFIYRNSQFSASSARKDTLPTPPLSPVLITNFEKRRQR